MSNGWLRLTGWVAVPALVLLLAAGVGSWSLEIILLVGLLLWGRRLRRRTKLNQTLLGVLASAPLDLAASSQMADRVGLGVAAKEGTKSELAAVIEQANMADVTRAGLTSDEQARWEELAANLRAGSGRGLLASVEDSLRQAVEDDFNDTFLRIPSHLRERLAALLLQSSFFSADLAGHVRTKSRSHALKVGALGAAMNSAGARQNQQTLQHLHQGLVQRTSKRDSERIEKEARAFLAQLLRSLPDEGFTQQPAQTIETPYLSHPVGRLIVRALGRERGTAFLAPRVGGLGALVLLRNAWLESRATWVGHVTAQTLEELASHSGDHDQLAAEACAAVERVVSKAETSRLRFPECSAAVRVLHAAALSRSSRPDELVIRCGVEEAAAGRYLAGEDSTDELDGFRLVTNTVGVA